MKDIDPTEYLDTLRKRLKTSNLARVSDLSGVDESVIRRIIKGESNNPPMLTCFALYHVLDHGTKFVGGLKHDPKSCDACDSTNLEVVAQGKEEFYNCKDCGCGTYKGEKQ